MAVKIRLMRMGKKKQPYYRVVAADSRSPRDGRFIEILGTYDPRSEPSQVVIDADKVSRWLSTGAKPTDTVARLLAQAGVTAPIARPAVAAAAPRRAPAAAPAAPAPSPIVEAPAVAEAPSAPAPVEASSPTEAPSAPAPAEASSPTEASSPAEEEPESPAPAEQEDEQES